MRLITTTDRLAARYVPKGAVLVHGEANTTCVYHCESNGVAYAIGYAGTAGRPSFNYRFRDAGRRQDYTSRWYLERTKALEDRATKRREANAERSKFVTTLKVGDVLVSSWGYEQTNVDFYRVERVVGKQTVELVRLGNVLTSSGIGPMSGSVIPGEPSEKAETFRARVTPGENVGVGHQRAHKWHGRPMYCSWYG